MFRQVTDNSINFIKSADLASLISVYRKLVIKVGFANNHIWFNTTCRKKGILPRYTKIKIHTKSTEGIRALNQARKIWLNLTIRNWYKTRDQLILHQKVAHTELLYRLHPAEFDTLDLKIRLEGREKSHTQYIDQNGKLKRLIFNNGQEHQKVQNNQQFYPRFKNLTDTIFTTAEEDLLKQGIKFAPPTSSTSSTIVNIAAEVEAATSTQPHQIKSSCALHIKSLGKSVSISNNNTNTQKTLKSIRKKTLDNDLILCKADKGNTCTVLTRQDYNNKVQDFISSTNATLLTKDPTPIFKEDITNCIKNCPAIFTNTDRTNDGWKYKNMNPAAPILYGLPKLHKETVPIRPIASYCEAPSFKLCQKFTQLFTNSTTFETPFSIKNSIDLVQKIKDLHIPHNSKLISFDVVSLFTSVPITALTEIVYKFLDNDITCDIYRDELKRIYNICIKQNYFCFSGKYYKVADGLPMGSPLSPLLAEIFMTNFEKYIMNNSNPYNRLIKFWYRYVDDILCLWVGTDRQLTGFLKFLNKQYNSIEFTLEKENNSEINYLDVTITRANNRLGFSIYRKPTFCDTIIPAHSNHPFNIKMSAFHSMLERLLNIPMDTVNFNKELNTILTIGQNNGYKSNTILRLLTKKQQSKALKQLYPTQPKEPQKWRRLQYIESVSQQIRNTLSRHTDIKIAFYNNKTINRLLFNNKERTDSLSKSGVYKINCSNCDCYYIGQTGRSFKTRIKEHLRPSNTDSVFANHLRDNNHSSTINDVEILHMQQKGKKLDALESFEIRKGLLNNDNILNEQTDIKFSPLTDPFFLLR